MESHRQPPGSPLYESRRDQRVCYIYSVGQSASHSLQIKIASLCIALLCPSHTMTQLTDLSFNANWASLNCASRPRADIRWEWSFDQDVEVLVVGDVRADDLDRS